MRRIVRLFGLLGAAAGGAWLGNAQNRARERGIPLRDVLLGDFTRFLTHRFNPVLMRLGLAGGRRSPYAVVEHVGRRSGATYRTPLYAIPAGEHVFIRTPFGAELNWVRNVRTAGHCRMQLHDEVLALDEPVIVNAWESPIVPPAARPLMRAIGRHYLRLHILGRVPGTLDSVKPEPLTAVPEPAAAPPEAPEPTATPAETPLAPAEIGAS